MGKAVEKADHIRAANGVVTDLEMQLSPRIIESAHDVGPLAAQAGIGFMRLSQR